MSWSDVARRGANKPKVVRPVSSQEEAAPDKEKPVVKLEKSTVRERFFSLQNVPKVIPKRQGFVDNARGTKTDVRLAKQWRTAEKEGLYKPDKMAIAAKSNTKAQFHQNPKTSELKNRWSKDGAKSSTVTGPGPKIVKAQPAVYTAVDAAPVTPSRAAVMDEKSAEWPSLSPPSQQNVSPSLTFSSVVSKNVSLESKLPRAPSAKPKSSVSTETLKMLERQQHLKTKKKMKKKRKKEEKRTQREEENGIEQQPVVSPPRPKMAGEAIKIDFSVALDSYFQEFKLQKKSGSKSKAPMFRTGKKQSLTTARVVPRVSSSHAGSTSTKKPDSVTPVVLERGKFREKPKRKKLSMLRLMILANRKRKLEQRNATQSDVLPSYDADAMHSITDSTVYLCLPLTSCREDVAESDGRKITTVDASGKEESSKENEELLQGSQEDEIKSELQSVGDTEEQQTQDKQDQQQPESQPRPPTDALASQEEHEAGVAGQELIKNEETLSDGTAPKVKERDILPELISCPPLTKLPQDVCSRMYTRKFREYCNHLLDCDIDAATVELLQELMRFQDRVYHENPTKYHQKKRLIQGLREVRRALKVNKLKCVILAPNLERVPVEGGIDDYIGHIISSCHASGLPIVFAMSRQKLGRTLRKKVPVSAVGILSYDGAQNQFKKLMELVADAKTRYEEKLQQLILELSVPSQNGDDAIVTKEEQTEAELFVIETIGSRIQETDSAIDIRERLLSKLN